MTTKIDIREIISEHLETLYDESTGKPSIIDYTVMFGIPALAAICTLVFGFQIDDSDIGTLVSVFSIFAGLLVNVLVLVYSISNPNRKEDEESQERFDLRAKLLRQCFSNISFSVVISLIIVAVLGMMLFLKGMTLTFLTSITVFLSFNFMLSLLMVIKRIHILFRDKF